MNIDIKNEFDPTIILPSEDDVSLDQAESIKTIKYLKIQIKIIISI